MYKKRFFIWKFHFNLIPLQKEKPIRMEYLNITKVILTETMCESKRIKGHLVKRVLIMSEWHVGKLAHTDFPTIMLSTKG